MADYFSPTVIQPRIPRADLTPLEFLVLTQIFDAEPNGDELYFFAEVGPADSIFVNRIEIEAALAASRPVDSSLNAHIEAKLTQISADDTDVELDLSGTSWEFIFRDVVRRSPTLRYVTAVTSFTCSKMRPDGFGGMAVLITADAIAGKSTEDILSDLLDQAGQTPLGTPGADSGL